MRRKIVLTVSLALAILTAGSPVSADVKSLPSPTLTSIVAGKVFDGKIAGYGWGEEDDPTSLSLDFTVVEPTLFAAAEIEALTEGDTIIAGYESYTVGAVEKEEGKIVITPKEDWLTPLTFTVNEDGTYAAAAGEEILQSDSFSFPGKLRPDLVYVNAKGESLSAAELLKDLSAEAIETYSEVASITFDEDGYVVELDFSA